ncbi:MAG: recombinase family protein [Rhodopila sp.]|jgi:DNA invertase Pin-like site-specific DNA recombinase
MTVFGYTRVSTSEQAADDRSSLDTQRRKILAAAELSGLTVDQFIEEPGVSGGKPLADRPKGGPLLAQLSKGDVLIVAKLDRAFRNAADALATAEQLKARKVDLIVADMGSEPVTANGVGRMFFGMLALVAEFERDRIKERSAEGRIAKRRDGGHIGGSTPFGYRKIGVGRAARLEPDPAQQAALMDMQAMAVQGLAFRAIAQAVQERHGIAVSHVTVRAALARQPTARPRPGAQASSAIPTSILHGLTTPKAPGGGLRSPGSRLRTPNG